MRISSTLAALLSGALLLAGCSDGSTSDADDPQDPTTSVSTESTEDTESTGSADPTESATSPEPGDSTVQTDLVSFEAPEGWLVLTPEEVLSGEGDVELDEGNELMDELGVSGDELRQLVSQADAVAVDDEGRVESFLANINVIHQPGPIGTEEQLVEAYQGLGDDDPQVRDEQVGGVDARIVDYQIPVGDFAVEGRSVAFAVGDQAVTISVSTRDADDSDEILQRVLDTLEPAV